MKADDVVRLIAQVTRELAPGESELVTPESVLEVLDARELALMNAFARACEQHGTGTRISLASDCASMGTKLRSAASVTVVRLV